MTRVQSKPLLRRNEQLRKLGHKQAEYFSGSCKELKGGKGGAQGTRVFMRSDAANLLSEYTEEEAELIRLAQEHRKNVLLGRSSSVAAIQEKNRKNKKKRLFV